MGIKFRALTNYDIEVYGYYVHDEHLNLHYIDTGKGVKVEIKADTLMQYTGFKDIEEKEIYEGDIVKKADGGIGVIKKGRYSTTDPEGKSHIGFYIKWKTEAYMRVDLGYWLDKVNVIGNIYENKELLDV